MDLPPPQIVPPAVMIQIIGFTGDAFKKLDVGMTREQVIKLLGRPDGVERSGPEETLTYRNRMMSGWGWDRADYYVVLTDGAVTSYGTGTVREHGPPGTAFPQSQP